MARPSSYPADGRQRAVRMVGESTEEHGARWSATRSIAARIGCPAETLQT